MTFKNGKDGLTTPVTARRLSELAGKGRMTHETTVVDSYNSQDPLRVWIHDHANHFHGDACHDPLPEMRV